MKLKHMLATTITTGKYKLDAFKILTSQYEIVCFFTTDSIREQLRLDVEPSGSIRSMPVCDIQQLFDAVEDSSEHRELFALIENSLNYERQFDHNLGIEVVKSHDGDFFVDLEKLLPLINITRDVELPILKCVSFTLDETVLVPIHNALQLLDRRRKKKKSKKKRLSLREQLSLSS